MTFLMIWGIAGILCSLHYITDFGEGWSWGWVLIAMICPPFYIFISWLLSGFTL